MTGSTVEVFFETREKLMFELAQNIFNTLINIVTDADKVKDSKKNRFFHLWQRLYDFYFNQPDIIFFIDQLNNSPMHLNEARESYRHFNDLLLRFFEDNSNDVFAPDAETTAFMFHENIKAAVKLQKMGKKTNASAIATLFWNGIDQAECTVA